MNYNSPPRRRFSIEIPGAPIKLNKSTKNKILIRRNLPQLPKIILNFNELE